MTELAAERTVQSGLAEVPSGKLGMWVFLCSDGLGFTGLLAGYAALRAGSDLWPGPEPGRTVSDVLDIPLTGVATFVLICSSVTMVQALSAARRNDPRRARLFLIGTILGGLTFLGFQTWEWTHFFREGFYPWTHTFWATFFTVTGYHGLHVLAGVIYLSIVLVLYGRNRVGSESIETAGLYWHFVDLVWILIFTFVYLI